MYFLLDVHYTFITKQNILHSTNVDFTIYLQMMVFKNQQVIKMFAIFNFVFDSGIFVIHQMKNNLKLAGCNSFLNMWVFFINKYGQFGNK